MRARRSRAPGTRPRKPISSLGWAKRGEIADLRNQGDRSNEVDAPECRQGSHYGLHAPLLTFNSQGLRQPVYALVRFGRGLPILGERDVLGRVREADTGQITLVSESPGSLVPIVPAVSEQQGFELLARLQAGPQSILACSRQIAHGFIALVGYHHPYQIPGSPQARQGQRIASVCFDSLGGTMSDATGGDHSQANPRSSNCRAKP